MLDVNAANVCLDKINISNLDIKVSAGNLELNQVTASTSTLEANAGNIKMKDTIFDTVAMKLNAGNLTFQGDILQTGRIQADLGNMTLHLNREEEAYTINGLGNGKPLSPMMFPWEIKRFFIKSKSPCKTTPWIVNSKELFFYEN